MYDHYTTDQLIAWRSELRLMVSRLENRGALRTVEQDQEYYNARALKRSLDKEIKQRIQQLPLF